jgi:hypothetical protein
MMMDGDECGADGGMSFFFGIPFYLQTVQVHLANCVMMQ